MELAVIEKEVVFVSEAERNSDRSWTTPGSRRNLLFRWLLTSFSFFPHACGGLLLGSGGPAFLDLLQLTNTNVEEGSIYFTSQYLGILIFGTVAGPLYDRFSLEPLMVVSSCLTGGINIAIPYCKSSIWTMAVVNGIKGGTLALMFTGCGLIIVRVWSKKESGSYMQATHFAYSIGGVIAPLIIRPFLAPRYEITLSNKTFNGTDLPTDLRPDGNSTSLEYFGETHVDKGFLIIGVITVCVSIPFIILLITGFKIRDGMSLSGVSEEKHSSAHTVSGRRLTVPVRVAFLVFIAFYFIFIVAVETLFQNYTMTFVVEHLKWSKTRGTQISSAFWGTFALGRFVGIFAAKLLTAWKLLAFDLLILSATVIVLVIGAERSEVVVWACVSVSGLSIGSLYASGVSYTQQRIMGITGKAYATFMMAATTGGMVNPLILGTMIEHYSPMWFVYLSVIICALCVIVFIVLTAMVFKWGKKADPRDNGKLDDVASRYFQKCRRACFVNNE